MKSIKRSFDSSGISKLPKKAGVYGLGCGNDTYYYGRSKNIQRRVKEHQRNGFNACHVKAITTGSVAAAKRLERQLIGSKCPPSNNRLKGSCEKGFWESTFGLKW